MAPKFCCCLPLRLGVLVISFIQFLLCGAVAGFAWWLLWFANERGIAQDLEQGVRISIIVGGAIYTFAAVIGLFGFFGAIFKRNGLVKSYLTLLYIVLVLQIASGVFSVIQFYRFRHRDAADCVNGSTIQTRIDYCNAFDRFAKAPVWSVWVSSVLPILIVGYACYVVHNYTRRLEWQKADREMVAKTAATGPAYKPVKLNDDQQPLTQPGYSYPYTDASNSFGSHPQGATGHAASYYGYSENSNKV